MKHSNSCKLFKETCDFMLGFYVILWSTWDQNLEICLQKKKRSIKVVIDLLGSADKGYIIETMQKHSHNFLIMIT